MDILSTSWATATVVLACLAGAIFIRSSYRSSFSKAQHLPYPPGPKGLPFIGNLFQIPTRREWITYSDWSHKYRDMIFLTAPGHNILVLNSQDLAKEILEKRGHIYSGRPSTPMIKMCGADRCLTFQNDPTTIREQRSLLHKPLGTRASTSAFFPAVEAITHRFLKRMLDFPHEYLALHRLAGSLILNISHGYDVKDEHDPLLNRSIQTLDEISESILPGNWLVDLIPSLQKLPDWFPGTHFKEVTRNWSDRLTELTDTPHEYVKNQLAAGTALPSLTSSLIEGKNVTPEEEYSIKWTMFTLYGAGIETTTSLGSAFFTIMALYPEVFRRAQEEVDRVIGPDRLPSIADREQLPYVNALTLEILRWSTSTPVGLPHSSWQDDIQDGYFIPKGTIVIANIYHMSKDPRVYKDPKRFNPERFLGENSERDPRDICFGFGRRICPGRSLGDTSLFISCAMSLAVFDIQKKVVNGRVVEPVFEMTSGLVCQPKPCNISIEPRSKKAVALVQGLDVPA